MAKTTTDKTLTPGQKKLVSLDLHFPTFPLTSVGSLPKQADLLELKYRVAKGFQQPTELERKERLAMEYWIREQENLGMDVLVDGEINRGDMVAFFASKIGGFEPGGLVRCYGNRYYKKPVIRGKLEWKEPLVGDSWKSIQRMTHRPVKAILTGPYTLFEWSFNEYYNSREAALRDLSEILKKEIVNLKEAGAKIIQIDEPALSSKPQEFSLVADGIRTLTHNVNAYFILHHSYGDLAPIWSKMQRLPVDNFDIEAANSSFALLPLIKKIPTRKDLTVGIIESHQYQVESPQQIAQRIRTSLRNISPKQLWFSPDCGLKTRTPAEADKKLRALVKAVKKVRLRYRSK